MENKSENNTQAEDDQNLSLNNVEKKFVCQYCNQQFPKSTNIANFKKHEKTCKIYSKFVEKTTNGYRCKVCFLENHCFGRSTSKGARNNMRTHIKRFHLKKQEISTKIQTPTDQLDLKIEKPSLNNISSKKNQNLSMNMVEEKLICSYFEFRMSAELCPEV